MKYFIGCVALLLVYTGCSSTETIHVEEDQPEVISSRPEAPPWYTAGVHSSSDSLGVYGYSLASAQDSITAVEQSSQTALQNLRFEIDKTAEEIRKELAGSQAETTDYNSPGFIIRLRNAISKLPLDSATLRREHTISEKGVHYSYTRAALSQSGLRSLFKNHLQDIQFPEKLTSSTP